MITKIVNKLSASIIILLIILYAYTASLSIVNFALSATSVKITYTVLIAIFFSILIYFTKKGYITKIPERYFILYATLSSILLSIISVLIFSEEFTGDPRTYYNTAIGVIEGNIAINDNNIFLKRTLPYILPILSITKSIWVLQTFNIITSIFTGLLLYNIISTNITNKSIPRIFYILYIVFPHRLTSLHLPSHDIPALFFLACILYIVLYINNKSLGLNAKTIIYTLILTISIILLEFQRSLGIIIISSLILYIPFLIQKKNQPKQAIIKVGVILLAISFYIISNNLINEFFFKTNKNELNITSPTAMIFSYNNLGTSGDYNEGFLDRYKIYPGFSDNNEALLYGMTKYFDQLTNYPSDYLKLLLAKSNRLHKFEFFRFSNKNYQNADFLEIAPPIRIGILIFSMIGLLFFLILPSKNNLLYSFIVCFISTFTLSLILLSEINQGYFFMISPFILLLSSIGITYLVKFNYKLTFKKAIKKTVLNSISFLCLMIGTYLSINMTYKYFWPIKMLDLSIETDSQNKNLKRSFVYTERYSFLYNNNDSIVLNLSPNNEYRFYLISNNTPTINAYNSSINIQEVKPFEYVNINYKVFLIQTANNCTTEPTELIIKQKTNDYKDTIVLKYLFQKSLQKQNVTIKK